MAKRGRKRKYKEIVCPCGKRLRVLKGSRRRFCDKCVQERVVRSAREIRERNGEFYDRWQKGLKRWIRGNSG